MRTIGSPLGSTATGSSLGVLAAVVLFAILFTVDLRGEERRPWTTSRLTGSPEPPKPFTVERVHPELQFQQPVELAYLPGSSWALVLEVGGKLYAFQDEQQPAEKQLVCDLREFSPDFNQAFSICPHPQFAENGQLFVCFAERPTAKIDGSKLMRLYVQADESEITIDLDRAEEIISWPSGGHNGCAIRFDAQGLLYFSAGDGARPYPPDEYDVSQDLSDLRSAICRIDVDRPDPGRRYAVPSDNPFVGLADARPEIWAYGFRNPWRFTIDPVTQKVYCGDVGWELWELVYQVERGGNYGWSILEGPQPIRSDIAPGPTPIQKPIVAYPHADGLSVTGGVVYRGSQYPELEGTFLYGDYVTGLLWGLRNDGQQVLFNEVLAETGLPIIAFANRPNGQVLVLSYDGGIYRLVENPARGQPTDFPRRLSETGLFASTADLETAPGVYRYQVRVPAYQGEGLSSDFIFAVPGAGQIRSARLKRDWQFPVGTVFAKTVIAESQSTQKNPKFGDAHADGYRVETQILLHDGRSWQPYCYVWNADQQDALLVDAAGAKSVLESAPLLETNWRHHSRAECRACHSNQTGGAVGFSYENLATLEVSIDETDPISTLVAMGILDKRDPAGWKLGQLVDPHDETQSLESRARSYLHANCAHCHRRGGGGTAPLDIVFGKNNQELNAIHFGATQGSFGLGSESESPANVIEPGDPFSSVLFYRMATTGKGHMPKLWDRDNDLYGLRLVRDWIASLPASGDKSGDPQTATAGVLQQFGQHLDGTPASRRDWAQEHFANADPLAVGLYERFLPKDSRVKRLGSNFDIEEVLALNGDSQRGRERYFQSQTQQCRNCHRLEGKGQMVGPDLDGIGKKRNRRQLLASIATPSAEIETPFATHSVVTVDGQVLTGLLLERTPERFVLRIADGKTVSVSRDDIEHHTPQQVSLMPEGIAAEMTAQELADLLEFLCDL